MPLFDLPLEELRTYRPEVAEPDDLDAFWDATLAEARRHDAAPLLEPHPTPLRLVEVHDVTFAGFDGQPVKAWLLRRRDAEGPLPAVVEFVGYGGGRDLPHTRLHWAAAGYAHLVMDTRGQGSAWGGGGHTPDPVGSAPATPGFMTRGIEDPATYYYRRVYTDAVRAVDAVRTLEGIDPARIAVAGGSQGGGIAIAVAGLVDGLAAAMPDVPFLCDFRRALDVAPGDPYGEIARYLTVHRSRYRQVLETLSYFDGVTLARRATAPALFSTSLMDTVCPPSTVFSAYNRWAGPKQIEVYRFNGHEGGGGAQQLRQLEWLGALGTAG